jgi:hypothetical protein
MGYLDVVPPDMIVKKLQSHHSDQLLLDKAQVLRGSRCDQ